MHQCYMLVFIMILGMSMSVGLFVGQDDSYNENDTVLAHYIDLILEILSGFQRQSVS